MKNFKKLLLLAAFAATGSITQPMFKQFQGLVTRCGQMIASKSNISSSQVSIKAAQDYAAERISSGAITDYANRYSRVLTDAYCCGPIPMSKNPDLIILASKSPQHEEGLMLVVMDKWPEIIADFAGKSSWHKKIALQGMALRTNFYNYYSTDKGRVSNLSAMQAVADLKTPVLEEAVDVDHGI